MASNCTYIHGIGSSQNIDTAGEVVDIAGLDCSSLMGSVFNFEHKSDTPNQIVGKILDFKKIFSEEDCENEHHKYFWDKCKTPYLYVMGRLFDDKKDSSKELAALFLDDSEHPGEKPVIGFSVEGAKLDKKGQVITRSIARKITCTALPANKACVAEIIPLKTQPVKDDLDSIFKTEATEIEFFKPTDAYIELLNKKEAEMNKDVGSGNGAFVGSQLAMSELKKAGGWTQGAVGEKGGTVNFQHPEHGMVSIHRHPEGHFEVKHNGAIAGLRGVKGTGFGSAREAGKHAGSYMMSVSRGTTAGHKMQNRPSPQMLGKAMDAGSVMAAPSQLVQGAALGKENIDKKMKRSEWLSRAEKAYNSWEKREEFESYMAKRLPHLAKGEIRAIGQVIALRKSVKAEGTLSKMYSSYFGKGTDIMMASDDKKLDKALKFGTTEEQASVAEAIEQRKKNPPKLEPKKKVPPLDSRTESEVSHIEPYGDKHSTVHLKSGHVLHGSQRGKFKVGDKVVATPHIMGTHILEHKK